MGKWLQGTFKPFNPQKYVGNVNNIIYRSSWELSFLMRLDGDPLVLEYSSEETIIPYRLPNNPTVRRYFVDFKVKRKIGDKIVTQLIEIKPSSQVAAPKPKSNKKTTLRESMTYIMNTEKWKAADKYCKMRGWEFIILTEKELNLGI
jgi:hypothetical protein